MTPTPSASRYPSIVLDSGSSVAIIDKVFYTVYDLR